MEKMKLNIQLFGASVSLTASETAVDDTAINNNQTYINLAIRVQTTKPTWNGNKTAYYQVTTTSQNNGTQTGSKYYFSIGSSSGSGDKTFNVTLGPFDHNADGTLNNVSISVYVKITDSTNRTGTASVAMATIPRASQPTTSTSVNMGSAVTINTNRYSSSFTHTLTYAFGGASGTIATNVGASTSWTPPLTLANQIPNATSGVATITCVTYSGGTAIGTKTTTITLNVPTNVVPTISSMALQEDGDVPSNWGVYVQNKSKIKVTYSASGAYNSTISSYTTAAEGYTYTNNGITTNYIRNSGNITINGSVVDSRGRQAATSQTPYIYPYANPTISTAQIQRCDINGNIDNNGEYMFISYGASISSCNGNNTSTFKVGYRVHNVGSYSYVPLATNVVSFSASGMLYTDGIYAADRGSGTKVEFSSLNTYDIQFYVADYFMANDTNVQSLDTGFDLMNFNPSGKAMAIGKVSEAGANEELFEVAMNTEIDGKLDVSGTITTNANIGAKSIELTHSTPFIDFHYNNTTSDFTSRIIENASGKLDVSGKLEAGGEIVGGLSNSNGQFRAVYGNYGFFIRNDGGNTYFMLTDSGDAYGQWNSLRPLIVSNNSGYITLGEGARVSKDLRLDKSLRGFTFLNNEHNFTTKTITINASQFNYGNLLGAVLIVLGSWSVSQTEQASLFLLSWSGGTMEYCALKTIVQGQGTCSISSKTNNSITLALSGNGYNLISLF